tara:strand:+ start:400 stop:819 length:420 start_codon:yes stop_codon:yes gene_type:complete
MHNSKINDVTYKVIKLINGETIIGVLTSDNDIDIEVQSPLLMNIEYYRLEKSERESLNLSRWIEPYTEQKYFKIAKSAIITIASASFGLTKYYEHFQKKMELWEEDNIAESKSFMEEYTDEEIYDELLDSIEAESKSIH